MAVAAAASILHQEVGGQSCSRKRNRETREEGKGKRNQSGSSKDPPTIVQVQYSTVLRDYVP